MSPLRTTRACTVTAWGGRPGAAALAPAGEWLRPAGKPDLDNARRGDLR